MPLARLNVIAGGNLIIVMILAMEMDNVVSIDIAELAAGYDDKRRVEPSEFERLLDWICYYGRVAGRALEIGCGTGFYLVPLAQRLPEACLYGVDITDAMLTQAKVKAEKKGHSNCFLAKADAHYLPFKEGSFDFVLMSQVMHYFQDKCRVAADVHRVSKQGAHLLVITTSHPQLRSQVDLAFFPGISIRDVTRVPSLQEIRHLFEKHGFKLFATVEFALTFRASSADTLVEWVARKPWSSYLLFSDKEFNKRLRFFKRNLQRVFGHGEILYLVPQTLLFFRKT